MRLAQLVLPGMRARGDGRIIMVGSMLASFPLAYRSSYVAAKAALKGFADAARLETSPFGVWISTVEPGSISTGIGERRTKYIGDDSPYLADFHTMIERLDRNERAGIPPEQVAALILRAIEAGKPKPLYATGSRAPLVSYCVGCCAGDGDREGRRPIARSTALSSRSAAEFPERAEHERCW